MASTRSMASHWIRTLTGLLLLALVSRTNGLAISYCSPDNTGSSFPSVYNMYQTNSECQSTCGTDYIFAVIQGQYCWCSNYIPADQVSTYDCNQVCPGFGDEWCGSTTQGLYGYFQLVNRAPSGTAGGSSSTSASSPLVSNTPSSPGSSIGDSPSLTVIATVQSTRTSIKTVESISTVPVVVPVPATSSTATSTSSSETTTSSSSSSSVEPTTSVYTSVTTVTGQVRTTVVSVVPTTSSDSTLGANTPISSNSNNGGGGVSTGKVVGIVLGVALGLGLLIGLGVWLWLRRRHQRNLENASLNGSSVNGNTGIPSRQVSQMSSAGLLHKTPRIITSGLASGKNPRSADTNGTLDRRSLGTDQRLNPYAIYAHDESRHSNVSLQDNQDYSRQLRIANPDP